MLDYKTLRPFLFKLEPEEAHKIIECLCQIAPKIPMLLAALSKRFCIQDEALAQNINGLDFYNPVGLAAGFDKNALMIESLCALGFSHLELGAVTPFLQIGNEKPRLWRHIQEESLQNAMGFNNQGAEIIAQRLEQYYPFVLPLGINIGKNKTTPQEKAQDDYITLAQKFKDVSDYLSLNLSSPNTPNLRDLQNEAFINELLKSLIAFYPKSIYLKISPDLAIDEILKLSEAAINAGIKGLILTNTTLDYNLVANPKEKGGISGKVLANKSKTILKEVAKTFYKKTTLISVGGISNAQEAYERLKLGASLIQVYSAMIFEGPSLVFNLNKGILELLRQDGLNHIQEAIGVNL